MISKTETLSSVLARFESARSTGDGEWMAICPAHADKNPSLSITLRNGKILLKCFSGCATQIICETVGLKMSDLFMEQAPERKIASTYDYVNEKGGVLYQVVRYEPKDFRQRKPDGKGGWEWKLGNIRRVLYRLPEVLAASDILIVEGEKDVETARKLGFVATTNAGGAGKWRPEYSVSLLGKNVNIIADNDEPGKKHALEVAMALNLTANVKVIERLPSLFDAKDLTEWAAEGNNADALRALIDAIPEWKPDGPTLGTSPASGGAEVGSLETICLKDVVPKVLEWFWKDRIPKNKQTVFSGNPDVGKTLVLCDIIARYTTGREWPDSTINDIEPGEVLLLSAEDNLEDTLTPRLQAAQADLSRVHFVKLISLSTDRKQKRLLALDSDIERLENKLKENPKIGLIVIDPISSYLGSADMNKEQSLRAVLTPVGDLAEENRVTIIGNSHFNKRFDVSALHKVSGAVAMTGVARAVWLFARDDEDKTLFHMVLGKGNLTRKRTGLKYRIGETELPTGTTPLIVWEGEDDKDADEVISKITGGAPEKVIEAAKVFLDEYVTQERPSDVLEAVAKARGIGRTSLFTAKRTMPYIKCYQVGRRWFWNVDLNQKADNPFQDDPVAENVEF